jgi:pimeloyl-ACP methyl ester carboxylesterase
VEFSDPGSGVTLAGTLTTPSTPAPHPAVVFVHGSGPLDRDETYFELKPFRVWARHLARQGIASLRFDKRGVGGSGGQFATATADDLAGDVLAAVACLGRAETVAPGGVGLLGHSEGGAVALTSASRSGDLAFCVTLAGPVLRGRENVALLLALLADGGFERGEVFERHVVELRALLDLVRGDPDPERQRAAVEIAAPLAGLIVTPRTSAMFGGRSGLSGEELVGLLSSGCLETCLDWDPTSVVPQVGCPVLALFGERDMQVPARENVEAARRVFAAARTDDVTVEEIPGANHLFQRCDTGMPDEYTSLDHTVSEEVLDRAAAWILSRTSGTTARRPSARPVSSRP